jgi:predicted nucleic acid-binding protein
MKHDVFKEAWDFYKARTDKDWSLTDCTSFVVMKSRGIERAFTADRHFEQAGFTVLIGAN